MVKNEDNSTDSETEMDRNDEKALSGCPHLVKSLDLTKIRKILKSSPGLAQFCSECKTQNCEEDKEGETDETLWLCLRCGSQLCGRYKKQHAKSHFETPRSDSHSVVMNTSNSQVWCYSCDNDIAENTSKKLLECVQMVKKAERKIETDQEKAKNMILAGLSSVKTHMTEEVSVTANIQLKSSNSSATSSSSTLFDKNEKINEKSSPDCLPRVRGLTNLGNTCFFNAMLQCLSQTPFLLKVLNETNTTERIELPGGKLELKDKSEIILDPIVDDLPASREFTPVFANAIEELQTKSGGVFTPNQLLRQFTSKWPQFAGGDQHDSHEALRHLLESVRSEDLRRYQTVILNKMGYNKNVKPVNVEEEKKSIVKFYGNQASERILCPEPVFRGFLVSTLTCQDCNNISPRQETFLDISLPVNSDKPHPPVNRRKTSPDPIEKCGPTKSQLKKEKREARRSKRIAKQQNRKNQQNASGELKNDDSDNNRMSSSESDADVEDSIDDSQASKAAALLDPNGNKVELNSPQNAEKKDDMPENPNKEPNNFVCEATMSSSGMENLSNQINKKLAIDDEAIIAIDEDEKTKAIKSQQLLKQTQHRTRQISYVDWSNTLGPRYQCSESELSIQSCLNHFMSVEYMMGNNKVGCDACTERINGKNGKTVYTNATKQFLISSPPAVLILHLKRFQVGMRGMFRKITKHVEFPTILDLAPFCASKVKLLKHVERHQKKMLYSLYGVVEHSGGMTGGHYIAYVKVRPKLDEKDKRWNFLPKGTKAELDQIDEQKNELEKQANRMKKRQISSTINDSDDSMSSSTLSSSDDDEDEEEEEENAVGGSNEPPENLLKPSGKWYYCSDSHVKEVSEDTVLKSSAYILFYERIF